MTKRIQTTIAENYVAHWGVQEALRELLQNSLDSEDAGHKLTLFRTKHNKGLTFRNKGADLELDSLLLGAGSKVENTDARGKYGEGFKLAALVLLRNEGTLTIKGPSIDVVFALETEEWFNTRILVMYVVKGTSPKGLIFDVSNLEGLEFRTFRLSSIKMQRFEIGSLSKTEYGAVLLDKEQKGRIYVGGMFVTENPGFRYGYDIKPQHLQLDRDRNKVDTWNLQWITARIWCTLIDKDQRSADRVVNMLKAKEPPQDIVSMEYSMSDTSIERLAKSFTAEDKLAYPVEGEEETRTIRSLGLHPVECGSVLKGLVRKHLGTLETVTQEYRYKSSTVVTVNVEQAEVLEWINEVMLRSTVTDWDASLLVVGSFTGDVKASLSEGMITLNILMLSGNRFKALQAVVSRHADREDKNVCDIWSDLLESFLVRESVNEVC